MTCRAGSTLSSEKAYKLQRSAAPGPQQDEAVDGQGSSGHAEPPVAAHITVATAAHVPQVSAIDMLYKLHNNSSCQDPLCCQHVWRRVLPGAGPLRLTLCEQVPFPKCTSQQSAIHFMWLFVISNGTNTGSNRGYNWGWGLLHWQHLVRLDPPDAAG